ncbi:universal stress protein [Pontibacter beigongshangensis]|uniref:universal stress protein n=1 Tax=Pontibacter beigongshangensis TaxID=2574733 RepID=UPI00164F3AA8|nr:universal stress protein [Pontibacter beigongshangensis]
MMKTILVPTDFSVNASVAARYALDLATSLGGFDIHFLHAYVPFTSAFQAHAANQEDEDRSRLEAEKGLAEFIGALGPTPDVPVTFSLSQDNLVNSIEQCAKDKMVSLVVMGTHGASGTRKDVLGSNTHDVAKSISVPLLIVPEHTARFQSDSVVFFTDYHQGDVFTLNVFKSIFGEASSRCTLVHIHKDEELPAESDRQKLADWKLELERLTGYKNLNTELAHVQENMEAVSQIIERFGATLTMLTLVEGRNFFETLLHKSLAKAIVFNPETPTLLTTSEESD